MKKTFELSLEKYTSLVTFFHIVCFGSIFFLYLCLVWENVLFSHFVLCHIIHHCHPNVCFFFFFWLTHALFAVDIQSCHHLQDIDNNVGKKICYICRDKNGTLQSCWGLNWLSEQLEDSESDSDAYIDPCITCHDSISAADLSVVFHCNLVCLQMFVSRSLLIVYAETSAEASVFVFVGFFLLLYVSLPW